MEKTERKETKLLEKAERDAEKLDRLRENCEFVKEVPSIPVSYPKCTHPDSKTRACVDLEGCPRRNEKVGG